MADRAAELHGGWLWTRGGGASPRGETWRRRWFTLVKDGRRAVLEFRAAQSSPKPLARLALTPSSECIRLVGADARRAANGRNCPAGVVLRFSIGGVTRLARATDWSATSADPVQRPMITDLCAFSCSLIRLSSIAFFGKE